jgi:O-antigen/teichoic acid export membrane protein
MKRSNVAWNIVGLGAPLLFAVAAIPLLLRTIGDEKFGVFMLAWGLVGFASLFDFGIGRATTHELSTRRGAETTAQVGVVFVTSERLAWAAGGIGAITILAMVHLGLYQYLNYSPSLEADMYLSGCIVALTLPLQVVSAMYLGVNEAYGRYRGISIIRVALGIANFLFPALLSLVTTDLPAIIATLLVSRFAALLAYRWLAARQIAQDRMAEGNKGRFERAEAKRLLNFGLWNTVSSILNPLMMQSDRFIIGAVMTVAVVSAYTVPYEVTTKLLIIPGAVTTVMFPFVTATLAQDRVKALQVFWRWFFVTTAAMVLICTLFFFAAPWLLQLWLGADLPEGTVAVAQIIAIGLIPYTAGTLMVALVHAHRRPDVTAKSHIIQAPLYIALSYWAIKEYGITGAGVAWAIRVTVDAAVLLIWNYNISKETRLQPYYE